MLSAALGGVAVRDTGSLDEAFDDPSLSPDIVLLDIQLSGANGLDGIALIHEHWADAQIVVVSADDAAATVNDALTCGAVAFLSKADRPEHMLAVLRDLLKSSEVETSQQNATLTPRQHEVLALVGRGLSNKMIGRELGLSEHTVRGHVQGLLNALGASRRSEAVFEARQLGLIP